MSNKLVSSPVQIDQSCEHSFAQVVLEGSPKLIHLVRSLYHPHFTNSKPEYIDELHKAIETLKQQNPSAHFLLGGDFNVGDVEWSNGAVRHGSIILKL